MRRAYQLLQRYAVLLALLLTTCDDGVSDLAKSYELTSQTSLESRYSTAPIPPQFQRVFNGNDGNTIVVVSIGMKYVAALVSPSGSVLKEVTLPTEEDYIINITQDSDGSLMLVSVNGVLRYGFSNFFRIDGDLNLTSTMNVQVKEDLSSFENTFYNNSSYFALATRQKDDGTYAAWLTKYDLGSGARWSTDVSRISNRVPLFLFNSQDEIILIRLESEEFHYGKIDQNGKILWSRMTKWADVFPEGHRWDKFVLKINGDLLVSSQDQSGTPESIHLATFSDSDGSLLNVTNIPIDAYLPFANQSYLGAKKILQTTDNGYMLIAATSEPPFVSLVKLDRKLNPGWIGKVNLLGDNFADAVVRKDGSIVVLSAHGSVLVFTPQL